MIQNKTPYLPVYNAHFFLAKFASKIEELSAKTA